MSSNTVTMSSQLFVGQSNFSGQEIVGISEGTFQVHSSVRAISEGGRLSRPKNKLQKVLRRLRGFVIAFEGERARVAFVEEGSSFEYSVSSHRLEKAGIKMENQPFEMDEVEVTTSEGMSVLGTTFKPLANADSVTLEPLDLSPEYKEKRAALFRFFANQEANQSCA